MLSLTQGLWGNFKAIDRGVNVVRSGKKLQYSFLRHCNGFWGWDLNISNFAILRITLVHPSHIYHNLHLSIISGVLKVIFSHLRHRKWVFVMCFNHSYFVSYAHFLFCELRTKLQKIISLQNESTSQCNIPYVKISAEF